MSFRHLRVTETYTGLWIMETVAWPFFMELPIVMWLGLCISFSITSTIWTEEVSRRCGETHTVGIFIRSVCRLSIHRFQSLYYFVYFIPIFLLDFEYLFILTKAWYMLCELSGAHCYTATGFANAESRQLCNDYTRRLRNVSVCPVFAKEVRYSEEILLPHMAHGSEHFRSIRTY